MPLKNRWLSSCLLSENGHSVLIDCGEGTQIALKETGQRFKPIDLIAITHFHADHISGLPGLLLTMSNEGRTEPVMITGPEGLSRIVRSLCIIAPKLPFPLQCVEYHESLCLTVDRLTVQAFPVRHSIPCLGYRIDRKRSGKFDPEKARRNGVPLALWSRLQNNERIEQDGKVYTPDMVLGEARRGLRVVYSTDTRPVQAIVKQAENADLLICEGMFGEDEKLAHAKEKGHMLFSEAAALARKAAVRRLWLTHYSPSLTDPEEYLSHATDIFASAECGFDGKTIDLLFDE